MRAVGMYVEPGHVRQIQHMGGFSEVARLAVRWALLRKVEYPRYERGPTTLKRSATLPPELFDEMPDPKMQYVSSAVADLVDRVLKGGDPELPVATSDGDHEPVKTTSASVTSSPEETSTRIDPESVEAPSDGDHVPVMYCLAPPPPGGMPWQIGTMSEKFVKSALWLSGHVEYEPVVGLSPKLVEKHRLEKQRAHARIERVTAAGEWRLTNGRWAWLAHRKCPDCSGQILTRGRVGPGEPAKAWCRSCRRVLVEVE